MTRNRPRHWQYSGARVIGMTALLAVGGAMPAASQRAPATLTVFAAASLTDAFGELGRRLEQQSPGLTVHFNFAGSQQLVLQLEQGAVADVYASADQRWMYYAREHDLIEGDPQVFARNRLVVIVPKTNPARIGGLPDLTRRGTKIVLAAAAVPVGKYSREALSNLAGAPGFPADYDTRVLRNVVSQEDNVKAVVSKVQLGEADAGIVYRSDVTPAVRRYVRTLDIHDEYNVLASYPIAVVKGGKSREAGQAFISLVQSDEGQ
ncbi:MAG: molybdate ABC transporter substrate-binding protein, partial [Gemmatimonadales bacterium]